MTVLLKKIVLYPQGNLANPIILNDDISLNMTISQGSNGSTFSLTLKNDFKRHIINKTFRFKVGDIIKVFAKQSNEANYVINESSGTDLLMTAEIMDVQAKGDEKNAQWILNCTDRKFLLLNSLWAKNYRIDENLTSPDIIKQIVNIKSNSGNGILGSNIKADYAAGFFNSQGVFIRTGGGYIQAVRPDNSSFPTISISKTFKPAYEWINDLSQPDFTNTISELSTAGSPPAPKSYYWWVDEQNNFHWEYSSGGQINRYLTLGTTSVVSPDTNAYYIKSIDLRKAVFDIVNMVIFNAGDDYFGSGILNYFYDSTTESPQLKPVYKAWTEMARDVIGADILVLNNGNYAEDNTTPGTLTWQGKRYTASYPFTPFWSGTSVANDTELNTSLRNYVGADNGSLGKVRAQRVTNKQSSPSWKGKIVTRGFKFNVGELIRFNSEYHGIVNADVRIITVQHNFNESGWETTINVQEDEEGINNG